MKLITETVKGVLTYSITDAAGNTIATAHRIHKPMNLYSLVIGGRPGARGGHDIIVKTMNDMIAKASS